MKDYLQALEKYHQAQRNLDNADPAYIETAVYELKAAEIKVSVVIREYKKLKDGGEGGGSRKRIY